MKTNRKVILWNSATAELLTGGKPGGIGVQLLFWAQAFSHKRWTVYSFYQKDKPHASDLPCCSWLKQFETKPWYFFLYFFFALWIFIKIRPQLIICRGGGDRNLMFIAFWARVFRAKCVVFFGSDADLTNNYSQLSFSKQINNKTFRLGLRLVKYFVVQNDFQHHQLTSLLKQVNVLQIPNIWGDLKNNIIDNLQSNRRYILWVGNTRALKRPQWVFEIAKLLPDEKFIMIGGNSDNSVYQECIDRNNIQSNVDFLGGMQFLETNNYFTNAKILLCTSEYEGFPNTFLQAWANNVPVLSTVNPSDRISKYNLGRICDSIDEFVNSIKELNDINIYTNICDSISHYFVEAHSCKSAYTKLMQFLELNL